MNFTFPHGLGDSSNAIHLFKLWLRRGYPVRVKPEGSREWLWKSCGYDITNNVTTAHPWRMPPDTNTDHPGSGNKTYFNFHESYPLKPIEGDVWEELINIKFNLSKFVSDHSKRSIDKAIKKLKHPIITLHSVGDTGIELKSLDSGFENNLINSLLNIGSVVLINNKKRPVSSGSQFLSIACNVEELYYLISQSDCMVGIDSGPFHLARMTETPRIGLFFKMPSWHGTLPSSNTICLNEPTQHNCAKRYDYNIIDFKKDKTKQITDMVKNVISCRKFCPTIGPDCVIEDVIGKYKNRMSTLLEELSVVSNPLVVYLGKDVELIRILGFFLKQHDGFLYVINHLANEACRWVSRMPVRIVDDIAFISTLPYHIDLLCSDESTGCYGLKEGLEISDRAIIV